MVFPLVRKIGSRDGRALWRLEETWEYASLVMTPFLGSDPMVIPAGVKTDFASVPQWALSFIGDVGHEAGLCHDWIYQAGRGMFQDADESPITRLVADDVLYEAMGLYGPTDWRRYAMYRAVRIGGGHAWEAHEQRLMALNPVINMEAQFA
jgi:hypothetical protein